MWIIGALIGIVVVIWCLVFLWNRRGFILRLVVAIAALIASIIAIQNVQYWGPPLGGLLSAVGTVVGVVLAVVVALAVIAGIAVVVRGVRKDNAEAREKKSEEDQYIAEARAAYDLEQEQEAEKAAQEAHEAAVAAATYPDLYAQPTEAPDTIYGGR